MLCYVFKWKHKFLDRNKKCIIKYTIREYYFVWFRHIPSQSYYPIWEIDMMFYSKLSCHMGKNLATKTIQTNRLVVNLVTWWQNTFELITLNQLFYFIKKPASLYLVAFYSFPNWDGYFFIVSQYTYERLFGRIWCWFLGGVLTIFLISLIWWRTF